MHWEETPFFILFIPRDLKKSEICYCTRNVIGESVDGDVLDPRDVSDRGRQRWFQCKSDIYSVWQPALLVATDFPASWRGPTKIYSHFGLPTNKGTSVPSIRASHGDAHCTLRGYILKSYPATL